VKWDVVVVGSGPAGSTTALHLAQEGAKVLIIEKKKLPRFKLCGGCLSARIRDLLPEGWERLVLNRIRGGSLGFAGSEYVSKLREKDVAYIVDRAEFDEYLTRKAVERGAELWEETEFLGFHKNGSIDVRTSRGEVRCDFLVGADGFYSKVAKFLGYEKRRFFRSLETWIEVDSLPEELKEGVIIDLGLVKRGYGWIFPKGEKLAVGVASAGGENLYEVLGNYIANHPFLRRKKSENPKGWMIPFALSWNDLHLGRGRVLLAGDSGGTVDPLLGEGIYWSVLAGKMAGESILNGGDDPSGAYRERVASEMAQELFSAGRIADLAYRFQRVAYRMGRGKALERLLDLLEGKRSYSELYRTGIREFLTSMLHFENFLHIIIDKILRRR
jgi:geranylgeranyl reductase family protein